MIRERYASTEVRGQERAKMLSRFEGGHEPMNAGGLWKLEKARKETDSSLEPPREQAIEALISAQ